MKIINDQEILTFKIEQHSEGERLDAYLASQIEQWSRMRLQRLIETEERQSGQAFLQNSRTR